MRSTLRLFLSDKDDRRSLEITLPLLVMQLGTVSLSDHATALVVSPSIAEARWVINWRAGNRPSAAARHLLTDTNAGRYCSTSLKISITSFSPSCRSGGSGNTTRSRLRLFLSDKDDRRGLEITLPLLVMQLGTVSPSDHATRYPPGGTSP
jgi:hypothetical protein